MKNYYNHRDLVLRTPLQPIKSNFNETDLLDFFSAGENSYALYVSSPNLSDELLKYKEEPGSFDNKRRKKLFISLNKYALRFHNRPTPFGLFSASSVLRISDKTKITIDNGESIKNYRCDLDVIHKLIQKINANDTAILNSRLKLNNTYYFNYHKLRYIETLGGDQKIRSFVLASVDHSYYLDLIFRFLGKKEVSFMDLVNLLISDGVPPVKSEDYIRELIKSQILIPNFEIFLTGKTDPLRELISQLDVVSENSNELLLIRNQLNHLLHIQDDLNNGTPENPTDLHKRSIIPLDELQINFQESKLFQIDTFHRLADKEINQDLLRDISSAINVAYQLTSKVEDSELESFKRKFTARFNEEYIPLSIALDSELGIGFGNENVLSGDGTDLVNQLALENSTENQPAENPAKTKFFNQINSRLNESIGSKVYTVDLHSKDFPKVDLSDLPPTFSVIFSVSKSDSGEDLVLIKSIGGTSATNLLSRFGTKNKEILNILKAISSFEKNHYTTKVVAGINHLPEEPRLGNVLIHPSIRDYEIPVLTNSSSKKAIPLQDILVTVRDNEIILYSKKKKKEIITRLDSAHNYSFKTLPVYKFLSSIQTQNMLYGVGTHLPDNFENRIFKPRIQIDNIILSLAGWSYQKAHFPNFTKNNDEDISILKDWLKRENIPDIFLIADGDNELVINTNSSLSCSTLIDELSKRSSVEFREYLFSNGKSIVNDRENRHYSNEFIATFFNEKIRENPVSISSPKKTSLPTVKRNFAPGSEWIYYKIYCGENFSDELLTEIISPLLEGYITDNTIDQWFYIRYNDPNNHIRLRIRSLKRSKIKNILQKIYKTLDPYLTNHFIHSIQLDTYTRELERYGSNTMELAENLFTNDSEYSISLLKTSVFTRNNESKLLGTLLSVDTLLRDFKLSLEQRKELMDMFSNSYLKEFNIQTNQKKALDKSYREYSIKMGKLLEEPAVTSPEHFELIQRRTQLNEPSINIILDLLQENNSGVSSYGFITSIIHMNVNRMINSKQRAHELTIYYFLNKYYHSQCARITKSNNLI